MEIEINDNKIINELQEEFNKQFPFLKIEFFSKSHNEGEASDKKLLRNKNKKIGDCRSIRTIGNIIISEKQKVSELESLFQSVYGLSVQVFRKSGKIWLETTSTDNWTLEKQNNEAKELLAFKSKDRNLI
jgi:hypothetical protein